MDPFTAAWVAGAIGTVVGGAVLGAAGYLFGKRKGKQALYKQNLQAAVERYYKNIDAAIRSARDAGKGNLFAYCQALISIRNERRDALTSLAKLLNSDIDKLESVLNGIPDSTKLTPDDVARLEQLIAVLSKTWPAKDTVIETELRKLLTELGLDRSD